MKKIIIMLASSLMFIFLCSFVAPSYEVNYWCPLDANVESNGININLEHGHITIDGTLTSNGASIPIDNGYQINGLYYIYMFVSYNNIPGGFYELKNFALRDRQKNEIFYSAGGQEIQSYNFDMCNEFDIVLYSGMRNQLVSWSVDIVISKNKNYIYDKNGNDNVSYPVSYYYSNHLAYEEGLNDGVFDSAFKATAPTYLTYTSYGEPKITNSTINVDKVNKLQFSNTSFNVMNGALLQNDNTYITYNNDTLFVNPKAMFEQQYKYIYFVGEFFYPQYSSDNTQQIYYSIPLPIAIPLMTSEIGTLFSASRLSILDFNAYFNSKINLINSYFQLVPNAPNIVINVANDDVFSYNGGYPRNLKFVACGNYNDYSSFNYVVLKANDIDYITNTLSINDYYVFSSDTEYNQQIYNSGYYDGYNVGQANANDSLFDDGYKQGLSDGATSTGAFGSFLVNIVDVPFKVFNNILNFDIFGFNIAGIVMSMLTLLVIIWLIKKLL